ncbi:hypothetical protein P8452_40234 [Trifolium repens]|nr:hypothetical protein P8452_40234 [Trifolium repens]
MRDFLIQLRFQFEIFASSVPIFLPHHVSIPSQHHHCKIQEEHEFDEYNNSQSIRTTPTNASTTPKHLHHHPPTPIINKNKNSSTKSNHKTKRSETEQKDGSVSCNKCRPTTFS